MEAGSLVVIACILSLHLRSILRRTLGQIGVDCQLCSAAVHVIPFRFKGDAKASDMLYPLLYDNLGVITLAING